MSQTLNNAISSYITILDGLTRSDSPILSSKSALIEDTFSLMSKVGTTPSVILHEFSKVLKPVAAGYKNIISSLSFHIGEELTVTVIGAVTDLECSLNDIMKEYRSRTRVIFGKVKKEIDYEPVLKNVQTLTSIVAQIGETVVSSASNVDDDILHSLYVIVLILEHMLIVSQGTIISIVDVLKSSSVEISKTLRTCLQTIDSLIAGVANAVSAVTNSLAESITVLLTTLVDLTISLNNTLEGVIGLVEGVTLAVGQITQNLIKGVSVTVTGITNAVRCTAD